jgi:hypothetical protein
VQTQPENTIPTITRSEARALGLTRYFTSVPCHLGHVADRLVSTADCVTCTRLRKRGKHPNSRKNRTMKTPAPYTPRYLQDVHKAIEDVIQSGRAGSQLEAAQATKLSPAAISNRLKQKPGLKATVQMVERLRSATIMSRMTLLAWSLGFGTIDQFIVDQPEEAEALYQRLYDSLVGRSFAEWPQVLTKVEERMVSIRVA